MKIFGKLTTRDERDFRLGAVTALCFWGSGAAGSFGMLAIDQQASASFQDPATRLALCRQATELAKEADLGLNQYVQLRQKAPFIPVPRLADQIAVSVTQALKNLQCSLCQGHEFKMADNPGTHYCRDPI